MQELLDLDRGEFEVPKPPKLGALYCLTRLDPAI